MVTLTDPKLGPYGPDFENFCQECFGDNLAVLQPKFRQHTYSCICGWHGIREFDEQAVVTHIQCGNCQRPIRLMDI